MICKCKFWSGVRTFCLTLFYTRGLGIVIFNNMTTPHKVSAEILYNSFKLNLSNMLSP